MSFDYGREVEEAVLAGKRAKENLQNALEALNSAKGWGIFDMLGGGFFSTMVKHSKMDKASGYIEDAKEDLKAFGRELGDISEYADVDLSTGDFWGFADWFFDGLLSDWAMQSRINEAEKQIKKAICKVDEILEKLRYRGGKSL